MGSPLSPFTPFSPCDPVSPAVIPVPPLRATINPVPDESADIERELQSLEVELRKLEAEYNMYFAGRLPRPPWETRKRVENTVKRIDRLYISNYGHRFKFNTLQSRFSSFVDLWDRGLRSREEGRPGPFAQPRPVSTETSKDARAKDGVISVTTFKDPTKELDKLQELHSSLTEARRKAGQDAIPFQKFAELIKTQVSSMTQKGTGEVAFRVAVKDGKVTFTARRLKGSDE
jgi:hypothetical protein